MQYSAAATHSPGLPTNSAYAPVERLPDAHRGEETGSVQDRERGRLRRWIEGGVSRAREYREPSAPLVQQILDGNEAAITAAPVVRDGDAHRAQAAAVAAPDRPPAVSCPGLGVRAVRGHPVPGDRSVDGALGPAGGDAHLPDQGASGEPGLGEDAGDPSGAGAVASHRVDDDLVGIVSGELPEQRSVVGSPPGVRNGAEAARGAVDGGADRAAVTVSQDECTAAAANGVTAGAVRTRTRTTKVGRMPGVEEVGRGARGLRSRTEEREDGACRDSEPGQ